MTEEQEIAVNDAAAAYARTNPNPMSRLIFWSQAKDRERQWEATATRHIDRDLECYEYQCAHGLEPYPYLVKKYGDPEVPWAYRLPDHLIHTPVDASIPSVV
jgi:hypothetical protein